MGVVGAHRRASKMLPQSGCSPPFIAVMSRIVRWSPTTSRKEARRLPVTPLQHRRSSEGSKFEPSKEEWTQERLTISWCPHTRATLNPETKAS